MLKHSPRAAISGRCWMPLQVGRSAPVRPKPGSALAAWPNPGPKEIAPTAQRTNRGAVRVAAISGPLWFFSAPCALDRDGLIFSNMSGAASAALIFSAAQDLLP